MSVDLGSVVDRLRRQGSDDGQTEVKACSGGLDKSVWDAVNAFANTQGGVNILGLSEESAFLPTKDFDLQRVLDQFVAGMTDGVGLKVSPLPEYTVDRCEVDGAPVTVIQIQENDLYMKPHGDSHCRNATLQRLLREISIPRRRAAPGRIAASGITGRTRQPDAQRPHLSEGDRQLLAHLSRAAPQTIHALADATGRSANALRPVLRRLLRTGLIEATAPPSSESRRYLLA